MKSMIPSTRPVNGGDLEALSERLGLTPLDASWLFAMPMVKWVGLTGKAASQPLKNPTLALYARQLALHPERSLVPARHTVREAWAAISEVSPESEKQRIALIFGREKTRGYAWITKEDKTSPVVDRLVHVFMQLWQNHESAEGKRSFLEKWEQMVDDEVAARSLGSSRANDDSPAPSSRKIRPILGEDLEILKDRHGTSSMDTYWLLGITMRTWSDLTNKAPREPVRELPLALLVRVLSLNPALCKIPAMPDAKTVYELLKKFFPSLDQRRLAVMFGYEQSSGYRWITAGNKGDPIHNRLCAMFIRGFDLAIESCGVSADHVTQSKAVQAYVDTWNSVVVAEARARGCEDVFRDGRWKEKLARVPS